jgi:hypothetical protein
MRVRISIIVVIVALVIWSAVSFLLLALTVGTHPCSLLVTVPPGRLPKRRCPEDDPGRNGRQDGRLQRAPRRGFLHPCRRLHRDRCLRGRIHDWG